MIASGLVVVAAVVVGVYLAGSPATRRARRFDDLRVRDLRRLSAAIDQYRRESGSLPVDLDVLGRNPRTTAKLTDPETSARYEYRVIEHTSDRPSYELCASFGTETGEGLANRRSSEDRNDFWWHRTGRQCFVIEVDTSM
jgi:type II secretory pathway pseudopilin PulG